MLSTFSCHTADYDEDAGLGHSKAFNARNCLGGVAELLPIVGFHPPSSCRDIMEATFACQTADYNESNGLGLSRTFTSADCPSGDDAVAVVPVFDATFQRADCRTIVEPEFIVARIATSPSFRLAAARKISLLPTAHTMASGRRRCSRRTTREYAATSSRTS